MSFCFLLIRSLSFLWYFIRLNLNFVLPFKNTLGLLNQPLSRFTPAPLPSLFSLKVSSIHHCLTSFETSRSLTQYFFALLKYPQFKFLVFTSINLQLFLRSFVTSLYTSITSASCNVNVGLEVPSMNVVALFELFLDRLFNWKFPFLDGDEFIEFEVYFAVSFSHLSELKFWIDWVAKLSASAS